MKSDGSYVKKQFTDIKNSQGVQSELMTRALQKISMTEDDLVKEDET